MGRDAHRLPNNVTLKKRTVCILRPVPAFGWAPVIRLTQKLVSFWLTQIRIDSSPEMFDVCPLALALVCLRHCQREDESFFLEGKVKKSSFYLLPVDSSVLVWSSRQLTVNVIINHPYPVCTNRLQDQKKTTLLKRNRSPIKLEL